MNAEILIENKINTKGKTVRYEICAYITYELNQDVNTDYLVGCPLPRRCNEEEDLIILQNGQSEMITKTKRDRNESIKEIKKHIIEIFKLKNKDIKIKEVESRLW